MSFPSQITNQGDQAVGRLINVFATKKRIAGFARSFSDEVTTLSNAIWSVIDAVLNPYGPILDSLGAVVDLKRMGLSDSAYLGAQRVQVRVLNSDGQPDTLTGICDTFQSYDFGTAGAFCRYEEFSPRTLEIDVLGIVTPTVLMAFLTRARQAGHRLYFAWDPPGIVYASGVTRPMVYDSVYGLGAAPVQAATVCDSAYGTGVPSAGYGLPVTVL